MLLYIEDMIDKETVGRLRDWLAEAKFVDGRVTAGSQARKVKNNEQVDSSDSQVGEMQKLVTTKLWNHALFNAMVRPSKIRAPLFSRYRPGMTYGNHVDNALMGGMRTDVSLTLFLSDTADYDGGELVIDSPTGEQEIKLAPGSAVVYSTYALHRVAPVKRGERLAVVTWARSLVRDPVAREILFDLQTAERMLQERLGRAPELDLIAKTHVNLLRKWVED
jgi:PKHD-type hydroxylase